MRFNFASRDPQVLSEEILIFNITVTFCCFEFFQNKQRNFKSKKEIAGFFENQSKGKNAVTAIPASRQQRGDCSERAAVRVRRAVCDLEKGEVGSHAQAHRLLVRL
jgi:hypothetical protein